LEGRTDITAGEDLHRSACKTGARTGGGQWLGEFVATFGLVATILGCLRTRPEAVPYAVGPFITAGYRFTPSISFANPAVTIARSFTDTFAGIAPGDTPGFIVAQIAGAVAATAVFGWLWSGGRRAGAARPGSPTRPIVE